MAEQRLLFPTRSDLEERFWVYHSENPHVYDKLVELAIQVQRSGRCRLGISALFERLRWWSRFETVGDPWKLNNSYRAFYARLLMLDHPELEGMFELRRSKADDGDGELCAHE